MKNRFFRITTVLFTLIAGLSIMAGCKNSYDGTTANFKQKQDQITGNYGAGKQAERSYVYISTSSIPKASKDSEITIRIDAKAALDEDSIKNSIKFYSLSDNATNKYYAATRGAELSAVIDDIREPESYGTNNTGSNVYIDFRVDTSTVETAKIAVVVDATKLKYKSGAFALNGNGNEKCGEESDSFIEYIRVNKKADGTTDTTTLNYRVNESYTASYLNTLNDTPTELLDDTSKPRGIYRFSVSAPRKTVEFNQYGMLVTTAYDDSLAEILAKTYKLQTQEPGSSKWTDAALTFTYHGTSSTDATNPYGENTYTTDTPALTTPGLRWRIIRTVSNFGQKAPDWFKDVYGHEGFFTTAYSKEYTQKAYPTDTGSPNYYDIPYESIPYGEDETEFIFEWDGNVTFSNKDDCSYDNAQNAQSSMFYFDSSYGAPVYVTIEKNDSVADFEIVGTDGFILVDDNDHIIEAEKTLHTDVDGKIDEIILSPKNKYYIGNVRVFVGSGTTIKENPVNTKQVKFGCYPEAEKGDLSGYVELDTVLLASDYSYIVSDDASSLDPSDYKFKYVAAVMDKNREYYINYQDTYDTYYFEKGKTYYIEMANGYNNNKSVLGSAGIESEERCYYAALKVLDADGNVIRNQSGNEDSSYSINYANTTTQCTIQKSGFYKIRCYSNYGTSDSYYYKGLMAYHIYEQ